MVETRWVGLEDLYCPPVTLRYRETGQHSIILHVLSPAMHTVALSFYPSRLLYTYRAKFRRGHVPATVALDTSTGVVYKFRDFNHIWLYAGNGTRQSHSDISDDLEWHDVKTKEIVCHRPHPRKFSLPSKLTDIEQVSSAKLLGVYFTDQLSMTEHLNKTVAVCNQRLYLLCQLKKQGMSVSCLQSVWFYCYL